MNKNKKVLITGISGQDGAYLAQLLLEKGYEVYGAARRSASNENWRLKDLGVLDHVKMVPFELLEQSNIENVLKEVKPEEIYNLAAMSFVGASFKMPTYTGDVNGLGVVRLLEVIKNYLPETKFYQASTSEMYGKAQEIPQNEKTPFYPRSPYGCSKLYAYWSVVNYREAYDLHLSSGILFNHECVVSGTPVIIRKNGIVDICPIDEIVPHRTSPKSGKRYTNSGGGFDVWDGECWTPCIARTATWHDEEIVTLHGRGGIIETTCDHVVFTNDGEKPSGEVLEGDKLILACPPNESFGLLTEEEAWFLGMMVADGYISSDGKKARVINGNSDFLDKVEKIWISLSMGSTRRSKTPSAFSDKFIPTVEMCGNSKYLSLLRKEIYNKDKTKRIPSRILNASKNIKVAFLTGYNDGDGLKAGNRTDEFKSFRTTSPVLAAGLIWMSKTTLDREVSVYMQDGTLSGGVSYLINPTTGNKQGDKGAHLKKSKQEVRKITKRKFSGWMFDLATESKRFSAGVGFVVVHNSPLRGEEFVTRKIIKSLCNIKVGLQDVLELGNMNSKRDWGHAKDYVRGMHMMLQKESPGDYVLATGEVYTVKDFVNFAAESIGWELDWVGENEKEKAFNKKDGKLIVRINPKFYRPTEVNLLCGDASKARNELGWEPKYNLKMLVDDMVSEEMIRISRKK